MRLQLDELTHLFFKEFQISSTLVLDVFSILAFVGPCLSVPFFLIVIVVIVIIIIEGEVTFLSSLFAVCEL